MKKVTARELASFGPSVGHGTPIELSHQDKVQIAKAKIFNDLEKVFPLDKGWTEKQWLLALRKIEAKDDIKPGVFLEALKEAISDLSKKEVV